MRRFIFTGLLVFLVNLGYSQKVTIDKRAYAYYTQEEIAQMPEFKIKQVNFLYRQSFIIPDKFKGQINPDEIDIRQYSKQRLPHSRAKVYLKSPGTSREKDNFTGQYIYLLSIDELQEAYENLR